jgi:hypothetical protein
MFSSQVYAIRASLKPLRGKRCMRFATRGSGDLARARKWKSVAAVSLPSGAAATRN